MMKKKIAGITLLAIGVVFIALGIARDEIGTVLLKATNICLECIGIG